MNQETPRDTMPFFQHLRELRSCLLWALAGILAGTVICYQFSTEIFKLISAPYFQSFADNTLIGTGPAEAFIMKIKVAFICGAIVSLPLSFYQLWRFIAPGLHPRERILVVPFVVISTLLFLGGMCFCYVTVLPFAFDFFVDEYRSIGLTPTIKMSEHLSMLSQALLGFGAIFEMPVLAYFLARLGVVTHHTLIGSARYAVVIIFFVAAVLTPPDVFTQFLMAGPLLILYGLSIVIVKYAAPGNNVDTEAQSDAK